MSDFKLKWKSENHGLFWHDLYVYGVYKNEYIKRIIGFQEKSIMSICHNGKYEFYLKDKEILKHLPEIKELYLTNKFYNFKREIETLLKWPIYFEYSYKNKKEIKNRLKILARKYQKAVALYCCTESYYIDLLIDSEDEKNNLNSVKPKFIPSVIKEQLEWYELCLNEFTSVDLLEAHLNKWKYIICSHQKGPYDLNQLKDRYENDKKNIKYVKETYKRMCTDSHFKKIYIDNKKYDVLSEIAYLRTELRLVWMNLGYLIKNIILKYYCHNLEIFDYTLNEIMHYDFLRFNENRKDFLYIQNGENEKLFYNGLKEASSRIIKNQNEIKGTLSFGKTINGYAQLINGSINIFSIDLENKILVVPQLTYELIPILGYVKGIVTDEGGITSHVNIIAREMNKSMVIGTIYATSIIKNGDYVELDCENSIVHFFKN